MGYSSWSDSAYTEVAKSRRARPSSEIFRGEQTCDPLMEPRGMGVRESRDSEHHPNSVPIIVAFDVTGSMGDIPTRFAQDHLGSLMKLLVTRGYVTDPQVLFAAVGDAVSDSAPLQVGQFESGLEMDMWLTRLWLEGRGGDEPESYLLPHWFAANHTASDAWDKRQKRGYLFTIGDAHNKPLSDSQIERVFGTTTQQPTSDAAVIGAAAERWELFHILVTRGASAESRADLEQHWQTLIENRVVALGHIDAICELMGAIMGLREGRLSRESADQALRDAGMPSRDVEHCLDGVV